MKSYVKFSLFQSAMIALLTMGLIGIEGAFNVYGALTGMFAVMYIFLWVDTVRDAVVEKIRENRQHGGGVPMWLRYAVLGGQALVLVWFGYFALALCLAFLLFTILGRLDPVIQPTLPLAE